MLSIKGKDNDLFQYNPCYCSMANKIGGKTMAKVVSIQPLLLFYATWNALTTTIATFQYNPCYCSIRCMMRIIY